MSKKKPLIIFFLFFLVLTTPFIFIDKENENKFSINKNINSLNLVTHKGESLKFNKFHNITYKKVYSEFCVFTFYKRDTIFTFSVMMKKLIIYFYFIS